MLNATKRKVLFVSHKANLSGAPLVLLEIIKTFKKQSTTPFHILIMEDGALTEEFKLLGKTYVWNKKKAIHSTDIIGGIKNLFSRIHLIFKATFILFRVRNTSLVFFNTISNGHIYKKLLFLKCTFICYVHELETAIYSNTNAESLQVVLNNTHLFIACSEAVKNNLVINQTVKAAIIKVLPTAMPIVYRNKNDYTDFINCFKSKNNIPANAVIIGAVASNEWRKGFDLFFPLITIYFQLFPKSNAFFIWKGFRKEAVSSFFDLYDAKKFNHKNHSLLCPHGNDSIENIACFDIHLLLSREDPYPLVVLEAATFAIPTVCFAGAGGSPEFIQEDSGYCVPYGDLIIMATRLNELVQNDNLRNKMGLKAQEKIKERHAYQTAMPAFISLLEN